MGQTGFIATSVGFIATGDEPCEKDRPHTSCSLKSPLPVVSSRFGSDVRVRRNYKSTMLKVLLSSATAVVLLLWCEDYYAPRSEV